MADILTELGNIKVSGESAGSEQQPILASHGLPTDVSPTIQADIQEDMAIEEEIKQRQQKQQQPSLTDFQLSIKNITTPDEPSIAVPMLGATGIKPTKGLSPAVIPGKLSERTTSGISLLNTLESPKPSIPIPTGEQVFADTATEVIRSTIGDELKTIGDKLWQGATDINTNIIAPVLEQVNKYQSEKLEIESKVSQFSANRPSGELSDEEKELLGYTIGIVEGEPITKAASVASLTNFGVQKLKVEVLDPIRHAVQSTARFLTNNEREALRKYAPSLAVLGETLYYPLLGSTGWNIPGTGAETDPTTLDPTVQKLINDKNELLGSDAGAALLSTITAYRDLPLWLIGGSTKTGMILGGIANEVVDDEGNILRGAATGLGAGIGMEKVMKTLLGSKTGQKGIRLLAEAGDKLAFRFGDNATKTDALINALMRKYNVEPSLLLTNAGATKMADDAINKVESLTTDAFRTQKIAPQAIMLDVAEDGEVLAYGVKDGKYGLLGEYAKNPEKRPVILSQRAKNVWADNNTLTDRYYVLTNMDKNPATRLDSIDDWTEITLPPENPALVFAWKSGGDKGGMMEIYRAGSHQFNADLLKSRVLSRVQYDGPDGTPKVGLGYYSPSGVVFAPDASENIPGAIPNDLIFKRTAMRKTNQPSAIEPGKQAWEIQPITDDDELFQIIDAIRGEQLFKGSITAETARGGNFSNNIPAIQNRKPAPFDNLDDTSKTRNDRPQPEISPAIIGDVPGALNGIDPAALFLLAYQRDVAKALMKLPPVRTVMSKVLPATAYGEKFKVDAAIQAFSTRHFKRYLPDLTEQLQREFGQAAATPQQRQMLSDEIHAFITGRTNRMPATIAPTIQARINTFTAERNADFAEIKRLGGSVPVTKFDAMEPELEKLYARDYVSDKQWIDWLEKQNLNAPGTANLVSQPKQSKISLVAREQLPELFGRQTIERELANDYFKRKALLNSLGLAEELANNPNASSPMYNAALGHTKRVDFKDSGLLEGRFVSEDTYNGVYTYPKEQHIIMNTWRRAVDMLKYNKTVLNPATWAKNITGNIYGTMLSNIVPTHAMIWAMPKGIKRMNADLGAYNADLMSNSPAVQRVKETLKFGLLGAEFEGSRSTFRSMLDTLQTPGKKEWSDKLMDTFFNVKDNTIDALGNAYSKIDMATKYSLYVNGLERWGVDLDTNKLDVSRGRFLASKLLGASNIAVRTNDEVTEMIKREVVRRIHLSLPMVDRASPAATGLSKYAGVLNPWMRTGLELLRVTSQIPYRILNEPGYALNTAKTVGLLGGLYALNKWLRTEEGISDKKVDDAWTIAPDNIKKYMPGGMATMFRASDGGIVFADMGDMLVESLQWFKGGDETNGVTQHFLTKLADTITGGGVLDNEAKELLSRIGLAEVPQTYNKPVWKQDDWQRGIIDALTRMGPQFVNNGWNLYNETSMPKGIAMKGTERLNQPWDMQLLKSLGLDVASLGTEKQKQFKLNEINAERKRLIAQRKSAARQIEGSSTGAFQKPFSFMDADSKIQKRLDELDKKEINLMKAKSTK